jgi:hypothetical protein
MDPIGYIVGVRLSHDHAHSAMPDAPVVPDRPRRSSRPPRVTGLRRSAAVALRSVATWVEPKREAPCRTA